MTSSKKHWSQIKEAGTFKGLAFLIGLHKILGRRLFNIILIPITLYFLLFAKNARQSSLEFLHTHYAAYPKMWHSKPGYRHVFKHLYAFANSIVDKLLAWSAPIKEDDFDIANEAELKAFLEKPAGQLIIGSHFGNLEFCRGFMQRYKSKTINALVYDQHSANFVNAMQSVNSESRIHIYQVDQLDIPTILTLKAKIEAGEWLFIAGDRIPLSGEERAVPINFLGRTAQFPIGPYMLAKVLQCEVQLMFSYRKQKKVYFELVPFSDKVVIERKHSEQDLTRYAAQFAHALEAQVARAPYQWFNFYPYWKNTAAQITHASPADKEQS